MRKKNNPLVDYSLCQDKVMLRVWKLYIDTEKASAISWIIDDREWNDIEDYLAIAEQLICMAWKRA